jgi:hypothetical protein
LLKGHAFNQYWNTKKKEGAIDSLLEIDPTIGLEIESQGELELPHCRTTLQARDLPVVPPLAIYAGLGAIVCAESVNRVIENIESIRAELYAKPLSDKEPL